MHPGNLILTERGVFLVDWGYATYSLNLFDLDYIQSRPLEPKGQPPWWVISPQEAREVLPAYFEACGLSHADIKRTHGAIMLWRQLANFYNALRHRDEMDLATCRENVAMLLSQMA
jgi:thiamine kinase-like enzyme